jgi:hypothetical protein
MRLSTQRKLEIPIPGLATVDFGSFPGATDASIVVTGLHLIESTSICRAWLTPTATAVHSADEHIIASSLLDVVVGSIVPGVGFTIYVLARELGSEATRYLSLVDNGEQFITPINGAALNRHWGTYSLAYQYSIVGA